MKLLVLMLKLIFKKPQNYMLAIIQIAFTVVVIITSMGRLHLMQYTSKLLTGKDSQVLYYLSLNTSDSWIRNDIERMNASRKLINDIKAIKGIEHVVHMEQIPVKITNKVKKNTYNLITYPEKMFNYKPVLQSGKWINEIDMEPGMYPAVISSDLSKYYNIGSRFTGEIYDNKVTFEVCGILEKPDYIMHFMAGGTEMEWSDFFVGYDNAVLTNHIFINGEALFGWWRGSGAVIKLEKSLSVTQKEQVLTQISKYGYFQSFADINKYSNNKVNEKVKQYSINSITLITMGLLGIIGISILTSIKELSIYAVWYICGSKWKNIYYLNILKTLIIVFTSTILTVLIMSSNYMDNNYLYRNALLITEHYILTAALLIFTLIITNTLVFLTLSKYSPIEITRRFLEE